VKILFFASFILLNGDGLLLADIPWAEAKARLARENELLARRPQGHAGTYFVICTLFYTPMESGFTAQRGFDMTPVTAGGLRVRHYPREFLSAVKKEGFGRIATPVDGLNYIRYNGGGEYRFAAHPIGRGANILMSRSSAAARKGKYGFPHGTELTVLDDAINEVFRTARWQIVDTGGALERWQLDLYWGDDEPLGPGPLTARPRGTNFEYGYALVTSGL
jgi:hypothetical protein